MAKSIRICVLGAGAMGLCAAVQVQEMMQKKGVIGEVIIVADKFNKDTTSDGAAGMFNPCVNMLKGTPREKSRQWFRDSLKYFHQLATSEVASEAGIQMVSGYEFYIDKENDEDPIYKELYYDMRECSEKEYKLYNLNGLAKKGFFYTTLMVEGRWFLPWLIKRFRENGGKTNKKKIKSLQEFAGDFDIVINCSGLGSNELLNNQETIPIRGQVMRLKAPWIKHFITIDSHNLYLFPGKETVVLGGTYQNGDKLEEVRKEDSERMWRLACHHVPSIKKGELLWEWVGMRPHREPVRLERETLVFGGIKLEVVHNYGHGGNGIALSWGTGINVCNLVESVIEEESSF